MGDPLWKGEPYGLSDDERNAQMNTYGERGDFNSLYSLREEAHSAYSVPQGGQQPIQLRRLDSVLASLVAGIPSPRIFLKMDTQGHDLSVFRGARGALDNIIGIQSEIPAIPLYSDMPTFGDLLSDYAACSYYPLSFHRVNYVTTGFVPEFDVILHRSTGKSALVKA